MLYIYDSNVVQNYEVHREGESQIICKTVLVEVQYFYNMRRYVESGI